MKEGYKDMKKPGPAMSHPLFKRFCNMRAEHLHKNIPIQWDRFWDFVSDIEEHLGIPNNLNNLIILRKDFHKGFFIDNLEWGTRQDQGRRFDKTYHLTYLGQTHTLKEWSEITGIGYPTLVTRCQKGWEPKKILAENTDYRLKENATHTR